MHLFREPLFFSAQEYLQSSHNKPRVHDSLSSLVRRPNIIEKKNTSFYITSLECPLAYFKQARNASEFQLFFLYFQKKKGNKRKENILSKHSYVTSFFREGITLYMVKKS